MTDLDTDEVIIPRFQTVRSTRINRTIEEAGIIRKYMEAALEVIYRDFRGDENCEAAKTLKVLCAAALGSASSIKERLEGMK